MIGRRARADAIRNIDIRLSFTQHKENALISDQNALSFPFSFFWKIMSNSCSSVRPRLCDSRSFECSHYAINCAAYQSEVLDSSPKLFLFNRRKLPLLVHECYYSELMIVFLLDVQSPCVLTNSASFVAFIHLLASINAWSGSP